MADRSHTLPVFGRLPNAYSMDPEFGTIYDTPPTAADDLTLIRGIHTREAVTLNHLGVYYLAQIALWQRSEVCAFANELGISPSRLIDEQWIEQAQLLCSPAASAPVPHPVPASMIRTCLLLVCALLVGCLGVYWLGVRTREPMRGVLSAEITSLRVPAEARLVATHVVAGSEVFSGETLLTLEKTEHLALIQDQQDRVRRLQQQWHQAEAQAMLDLQWRNRDLDRELLEVRTRAHLIQEVTRQPAEPRRTASAAAESMRYGSQTPAAVPVSRSRELAKIGTARVNGLQFVSGSSGQGTIGSAIPLLLPVPVTARQSAPSQPVANSEPSMEPNLLQLESCTVELRLQQLEELRQNLPAQVREAAGAETLRLQHDEASRQLIEMNALSREVAVLCPAYGVVGEIRCREGDTLPAGEVMLKILHTDRRFVLIHVPTQRVNELHRGATVDLVFPGKERYVGVVTNLPMLADSNSINGDSMATVRVEPVGKLWPTLPIGTRIDAVLPR